MNSNTRKKLKMKTVGQQGLKIYRWLFEVGGDRDRCPEVRLTGPRCPTWLSPATSASLSHT